MEIEKILTVITLVGVVIHFTRYFERFDEHLRNQQDLAVKALEMYSEMMERPEIMNGFLARSGRVIVPLKTQARAAGKES